ncbi:Putative voltage-gated potassium channel subunit beta AltName: Full=K(+) channel subunit beta [Serendipita indica DSM 11827]|nr:Putative voltage-gated potassium channel subunit beta AltName: Full=K(+) channel subunit beta [Serendipita indica DSM 11827]
MTSHNNEDFFEFKMNPKMEYRRLGPSGLRVSALSLGGWLTLGGTVKGDPVKEIVKKAWENGINFIDTAEAYAQGNSEREIGRVLKELKIRRSDLVLSTKVFFGVRKGPNATGLSRKHIIEGLHESLERLQTPYVDIYFAHRPDPTVPMEEVVRAFNYCINAGLAHYWATSEWSAREIEEAFHVADKLGLVGPIAEQAQHNLLHRERPEVEYAPIYAKYGIKTTVWSALASGKLTGKYNDGIPKDSRFANHSEFFKDTVAKLESPEGKAELDKIRALTKYAREELNTGIIPLSLAYIAAMPNTGTIILGASKPEQLDEQFEALDLIPRITEEVREKVEAILDNKPKEP